MSLYLNKFRNETTRLRGYDYGSDGAYHIILNTKDRAHSFGKVMPSHPGNAYVQLSEIGAVAEKYWQEIPKHYPFVEVDEYVIMPDHIHGILILNGSQPNTFRTLDWKQNEFGPQSKNLSAVIRAYKCTTKRYANENKIRFNWQALFYEHIIRISQALESTRKYIRNNPAEWLSKKQENVVANRI